ncbi:MAG: hypothetical protein ABI321_07450 [Polyangia bacterium]
MRRWTHGVVAICLALLACAAARADEDGGDLDGIGVDGGIESPALVEQAPMLGPQAEPAHQPAVAFVQIGERHLCDLRLDRAGEKVESRARRASRVLEQAIEDGHPGDVQVRFASSLAVLYVGDTPFIQLDAEDATAAGDPSVAIHAESCASAVRQGLRTEMRRRSIANLVFSISLIVFSGLLAFLLLRAVSSLAARVGTHVETTSEIPALKIGTIELLTPGAVRIAASTTVSVGKPLVQIVIVIGWILTSLSLLPFSQSYGRRLTGYLLVPLTTFLGRIGGALPVLVLVALGAFTLAVLMRFLRVFFESVAQGGIQLRWLAPRRALPTSVVIRALVILGALLAVGPLLTGNVNEWGALRIGGVGLTVAFVLAMTPSLANTAIGAFALFSGHYRIDVFIEIGRHSGRLAEVTLSDLRIIDRSGAEIRVPHVRAFLSTVRVLGESLPSHYEIVVDSRVPQGPIRKALVDALRRQGRAAHVELTEIEGERAVYFVVGTAAPGEEDLASAIADALTRAGVAFARIRKLDTA